VAEVHRGPAVDVDCREPGLEAQVEPLDRTPRHADRELGLDGHGLLDERRLAQESNRVLSLEERPLLVLGGQRRAQADPDAQAVDPSAEVLRDGDAGHERPDLGGAAVAAVRQPRRR
jgi:hypothetical protein